MRCPQPCAHSRQGSDTQGLAGGWGRGWTTPQGWKHKVLQRELKWDGTVRSLRREPHVSPESGHGVVMDQFDNSRVILTNPLIWPCSKPSGRCSQKSQAHQGCARTVPALSPPRATWANRAVCVTHGACSEISCPHFSQEQGGARQLLLIQNTPCANTRLEEESVEPLEPVYCHSTAQRSQPTPRQELLGLAEEAVANLLPTLLLDQ